jgi:hypothetical protein
VVTPFHAMSLLYARQIGNESDGQHQEGMDEKKVANGMSRQSWAKSKSPRGGSHLAGFRRRRGPLVIASPRIAPGGPQLQNCRERHGDDSARGEHRQILIGVVPAIHCLPVDLTRPTAILRTQHSGPVPPASLKKPSQCGLG